MHAIMMAMLLCAPSPVLLDGPVLGRDQVGDKVHDSCLDVRHPLQDFVQHSTVETEGVKEVRRSHTLVWLQLLGVAGEDPAQVSPNAQQVLNPTHTA